ncbi:CDP-alcohol phosphatidyltransferase family protein [Campylobacter geochelonis]|uniref:CDP-alcohol phosphatidyltransferase family protein n=1 Tax=Campylobacter geochelonis TaxID=1780362 RepID=UPI0007706EDF|nr:CDP-alcohol phosphatidyltransferase family protein [Campylobacter geochelonis]CZE46940.1 CDP-alcohol phosphatidyltransferase [Campylobacter geochelonis]CZE50920.1 CDP-alcohol phosphatidyltransferase [Campylobacter geochelonis]
MFDYFGEKELEKQMAFKAKRDAFLKKPVQFLTNFGVKPNHITIFAVVLFFIACGVVMEHPVIGGLLGFIYCLLDGLDGPLARYQKIDSKAGSLMDIFADQVGIIVLPILSVIYFDTNFVFAYIFGLFYIVEIFLLTILNAIKIPFGFVLRVKYVYYGLFLLCTFIKTDLLVYFHVVFGGYYLIHSIFLYFKLINFYKHSR